MVWGFLGVEEPLSTMCPCPGLTSDREGEVVIYVIHPESCVEMRRGGEKFRKIKSPWFFYSSFSSVEFVFM